MPKNLQKSLQDYLSKIKKPTPQIQFPSSKTRILRGCKNPKTLSFALHRDENERSHEKDKAATLSDVDRFLFENFKSLYLHEEDKINEKQDKEDHEDENRYPNEILFESPRFLDPPPDLCASHRFFVSAGSSSSLIEDSRTSVTTTSEDVGSNSTISNDYGKNVSLPDDCVAVLKYSPSPCDDFRRSMQEIVDARMQHSAKVDWDFMEELLFCYLNLNEKKSYKFILSAFVDVVVVLRRDSGEVPARSRNVPGARERRMKLREV